MKHERDKNDHYVTPKGLADFAVDNCILLKKRYCKNDKIEKMSFLEPGCGLKEPFSLRAIEHGINDVTSTDIMDIAGPRPQIYGEQDFFNPDHAPQNLDRKFDIIATNPPFKDGVGFINICLELLSENGVLAILQKLNFQASQGRYDFFQNYPPVEIHNLIKRPSFAHGKTDSQEYAIYFWLGSELALKIRKKWGVRSIVKWQDNRGWVK